MTPDHASTVGQLVEDWDWWGTDRAAETLRAILEEAWDAGHNHCFHVDPPKASGNPYRADMAK